MDSSCVHDKQKEIANVVKNRLVRGSIAAAAALVPLAGVSALAASPAGAVAEGHHLHQVVRLGEHQHGRRQDQGHRLHWEHRCQWQEQGDDTDTTVTIKWANGKSTSFTQSAHRGSGCTQPGALTEVESGTSPRTTREHHGRCGRRARPSVSSRVQQARLLQDQPSAGHEVRHRRLIRKLSHFQTPKGSSPGLAGSPSARRVSVSVVVGGRCSRRWHPFPRSKRRRAKSPDAACEVRAPAAATLETPDRRSARSRHDQC